MVLNHVHIFKAEADVDPGDELAAQLMSAFSYDTTINLIKRIFPDVETFYLNPDFINQDKNHIAWKLMLIIAENSKMKKTDNFVYVVFDEKKCYRQIKKVVEEYC